MLNPFPQLLDFAFFAPTLLRTTAAMVFLYVAYKQYGRRQEIARLRFPIVGHGAWIATLVVGFHTVVGAMLFFGYYTQVVALLGSIGLLKGWWLNKRYPSVVILPNSTILVLLAVMLSLLLTGAGALAMDLPL